MPRKHKPAKRLLTQHPYFAAGKNAAELELLRRIVIRPKSASNERFQVVVDLWRWQNKPGNFKRVSKYHCQSQIPFARIEAYFGWVLNEKPVTKCRWESEHAEAMRVFREYMAVLSRRAQNGELRQTAESNLVAPQTVFRTRRFRPETPSVARARARAAGRPAFVRKHP